jgi:hypothetical protein
MVWLLLCYLDHEIGNNQRATSVALNRSSACLESQADRLPETRICVVCGRAPIAHGKGLSCTPLVAIHKLVAGHAYFFS